MGKERPLIDSYLIDFNISHFPRLATRSNGSNCFLVYSGFLRLGRESAQFCSINEDFTNLSSFHGLEACPIPD